MSEGIAYQNKDILFKILGQTYKEKSFAAYGIDLPPIRELLPTNLPKISANEKDIDNLFLLEDGNFDLRLIVIYTGDVKSAESDFETKCLTLRTKQAFLSHIDGETAFNTILQKIHSGTVLEDDDLMKLVILPLTVPGPKGKQEMLEKVVDLAEQIRRKINMTQSGQLYEKEKIEYRNQKIREMALKLLLRNIDIIDLYN